MKTYRVSRMGRIRTAILVLMLLAITVYAGRKAWGLWRGLTAKPSDVFLFNLSLNTTIPAMLLTLLTLTAIIVIWYLVLELLSQVDLSENGILLHAPGYRLFYRWNEITALDVISGPAEDAVVRLRVETETQVQNDPVTSTAEAVADLEPSPDEIAPYLTAADLRKDKTAQKRARTARQQTLARLRARATRPDGRGLPVWLRLLYPQARHPDRLLLYPALENRTLLLTEIESHLAKV